MEAGGEWVASLVLEQEDEGCPPQEVARRASGALQFGACSLGRRVLRVQGLRGLQADNAASHILKHQCLPGLPASVFFARADLATAVYLIKVKMAESRPWQKWCVESISSESLLAGSDSGFKEEGQLAYQGRQLAHLSRPSRLQSRQYEIKPIA